MIRIQNSDQRTARAPKDDDPDYFGPTEIAETAEIHTVKPDDTALRTSLQRCALSNGGKGLFADKASVDTVLNDAYALSLMLVEGGDAACEQALQHKDFPTFERKKRKHKPFLYAVYLGAKPPDENAARKMCSDYSTILENASDNAIAPFGFLDWRSGTTLAACLDAVRAKRKSAKAAKPKAGADVLAEAPGDGPPIIASSAPPALAGLNTPGTRYPLPPAFIEALNIELEKVQSPSDEAILAACNLALRQFLPAVQEVSNV